MNALGQAVAIHQREVKITQYFEGFKMVGLWDLTLKLQPFATNVPLPTNLLDPNQGEFLNSNIILIALIVM